MKYNIKENKKILFSYFVITFFSTLLSLIASNFTQNLLFISLCAGLGALLTSWAMLGYKSLGFLVSISIIISNIISSILFYNHPDFSTYITKSFIRLFYSILRSSNLHMIIILPLALKIRYKDEVEPFFLILWDVIVTYISVFIIYRIIIWTISFLIISFLNLIFNTKLNISDSLILIYFLSEELILICTFYVFSYVYIDDVRK